MGTTCTTRVDLRLEASDYTSAALVRIAFLVPGAFLENETKLEVLASSLSLAPGLNLDLHRLLAPL